MEYEVRYCEKCGTQLTANESCYTDDKYCEMCIKELDL